MTKNYKCPVFFVDDTKNPLHFFPNAALVATEAKIAMRVLESFKVDLLFLDYYLDTGCGQSRYTGMELLERMRYRELHKPARIILISSESSCNDKMAEFLVQLGYKRSPQLSKDIKVPGDIPAIECTFGYTSEGNQHV